jgi:serine phosphatase RsbU (regulator of sigma subunit)
MGDAAEDGFAGDYLDALRRHVESPTERSLQDAYELGRRALVDGRSLLELIAVHQFLAADLLGSVPEGLERADAFLREALASFEIAGLGVREARAIAAAERERTEVLGHLSEAHLAILAAPSVQARLQIVCDRAMALVGGARARVELAGDPGPRRIASQGDGPVGSPPSRVPIPSRTGAGVLEVWPMPGGFLGAADRAVLGQLALLASGTLDDARRLEQERVASLELQRSLLPGILPDYAGISVAARYLASERSNRVGGDWYDVLPLDEHCYAAVVGDVMGHGLREASLMAAMRVAFHAYAIEDSSAAGIVERVDRLLTRLAPDHLATAVLVVLDVADHHMSIVNAGHPPPVRIDRQGHAELLERGRSLPLGVQPEDDRPDAGPIPLERGTTLLLYTDGLTERIDRAGGDGEATLLEAIEGFRGTVDELCQLVLLAMLPEHSSDDTCLLAIGID